MIRWQAPEFPYYYKDIRWYGTVITTFIALSALSLWQKNFLFIIFLGIAFILVMAWSQRHPRNIDFELSEKGLKIADSAFYAFENLQKFYIKSGTTQDWDQILIVTKSRLRPVLKIPVSPATSGQAKEILLKFLPEEEIEETLVETLSEWIGF